MISLMNTHGEERCHNLVRIYQEKRDDEKKGRIQTVTRLIQVIILHIRHDPDIIHNRDRYAGNSEGKGDNQDSFSHAFQNSGKLRIQGSYLHVGAFIQ